MKNKVRYTDFAKNAILVTIPFLGDVSGGVYDKELDCQVINVIFWFDFYEKVYFTCGYAFSNSILSFKKAGIQRNNIADLEGLKKFVKKYIAKRQKNCPCLAVWFGEGARNE